MQSASLPSLKVLSFGAGAIGTYIGGSLALAGHEVVFMERPGVVEELRERGLRLDLSTDKRREGSEAFVIPPPSFRCASSLEEALLYGPFDVGLFALKSFDTLTALESLQPHADKVPPLLCLSNGVDNEPAIAAALGPDKVIPGTVTSAIGRRGRGRYRPGEAARHRRGRRASALRASCRRAGRRLSQLPAVPRGRFDEVVQDAHQPGRQPDLRHPGYDRRAASSPTGGSTRWRSPPSRSAWP